MNAPEKISSLNVNLDNRDTPMNDNFSDNDDKIVDRYGFFGGEQYMDPNQSSWISAETIRQREIKWMNMLSDWDAWMSKKFNTVRKRCRKGIPPSLRSRVWQNLSRSNVLIHENRNSYAKFLSLPSKSSIEKEINNDIGRQFPFHEHFSGKNNQGQLSLKNILRVFSVQCPSIGYCQAQAPIAAALLIHMSEEEAYWTFYAINKYYMTGYFDDGLERVKVECGMFSGLMKRYLPTIHKYLVGMEIETILFCVDWFMCLFTRNLPWDSVLHVLDMFFCEGIKVVFRISLAIMELALSKAETRAKLNTPDLLLPYLRSLPAEIVKPEILIPTSMKYCKISEAELASDHIEQRRKLEVLGECRKKILT